MNDFPRVARHAFGNRRPIVATVTMKQASLAQAKAHISEIVDAAEHRGASTLIHRHGKPSAVVVLVEIDMPVKKKRRWMTPEEIVALHAIFSPTVLRRAPR